uniref:Uncharacterized protein n=1 Tax=Aegilops tauschii subsp. strangulata TaxID=200361 RepID=A0A453QZJ4_AEGTS
MFFLTHPKKNPVEIDLTPIIINQPRAKNTHPLLPPSPSLHPGSFIPLPPPPSSSARHDPDPAAAAPLPPPPARPARRASGGSLASSAAASAFQHPIVWRAAAVSKPWRGSWSLRPDGVRHVRVQAGRRRHGVQAPADRQ